MNERIHVLIHCFSLCVLVSHFICLLQSNIRCQCLRLWPDLLPASSTTGGANWGFASKTRKDGTRCWMRRFCSTPNSKKFTIFHYLQQLCLNESHAGVKPNLFKCNMCCFSSVLLSINDIPLFYAAKKNSVGCIKKLLSCASTNIFERGKGPLLWNVAVVISGYRAVSVVMCETV